MPQLDFTTFAPQLFWLLVTFAVLYAIMRWLAMPRVGRAIDARRDKLQGDLARASQLRSDAEAVLAEYQKTLASARIEAQATLRETADRLAADAAERQRGLAEALAGQIDAAEQRIAAMKDEALAEIRGIAVEVGGAVVEKLTGAPADPARLAAAVNNAVDNAVGERAH
ncbi:MAG TPA: F0F1 ATP synthase subunit B' [Stellaceae bacterium]|jgi:F-type H+-transporting ATPase subunit b|nr:F0F1 ATP synthase subunit B' [Stellaceae bacterium]